MKKINENYFIVIGALLIIAGFLIFPDDDIIGIIGVLFGSYNMFKGLRLRRGIKPILVRKQEEKRKKEAEELENKFNEDNK